MAGCRQSRGAATRTCLMRSFVSLVKREPWPCGGDVRIALIPFVYFFILFLYLGAPTVARAMVLNAAQLGSYTQAKEMLMRYLPLKDNIHTHFLARHISASSSSLFICREPFSLARLCALSSLVSGLLATAVSIPVDITKTRIQTMKTINGWFSSFEGGQFASYGSLGFFFLYSWHRGARVFRSHGRANKGDQDRGNHCLVEGYAYPLPSES